MAQNIYDDPAFFDAYSRLPRSVRGLDAAPEWPVLRAMLPDMRGRRVLDLGCGYGWFCRWARAAGAARVTGVDLSERMLARAAADTRDEAIIYVRADLERYAPPPGSLDVVYSSLALHYLETLPRLIESVYAGLVPGGTFVFSAEHPIFTAPRKPGWRTEDDGRRTWPVDAYLDEGPRRTDWLKPGVIKQHRTVGTYLDLLLGAGFALTRLVEWGPTPEQIAAEPDWADERERPAFLLVACLRAD